MTDALPLLMQAMEQAITMETVVYQTLCRLSLGEAQMLTGHLDEAYALAEEALAFARAHQERGNQAYALHLLGEIAAQCEPANTEEAAASYWQSLTLANELGMRPLQAHCYRDLGTLHSQMRQLEQARAELSTAIDMYRDMEMMFWLPETEATLAQMEANNDV